MKDIIRNAQLHEVSKAYRAFCIRPSKTNKNNLQREVDTYNTLAQRYGFDKLLYRAEDNFVPGKVLILPNYNPDYKYS